MRKLIVMCGVLGFSLVLAVCGSSQEGAQTADDVTHESSQSAQADELEEHEAPPVTDVDESLGDELAADNEEEDDHSAEEDDDYDMEEDYEK